MRADEMRRLDNRAKRYEERAKQCKEWAKQAARKHKAKPLCKLYLQATHKYNRVAHAARGVIAAQARLDELLREAK